MSSESFQATFNSNREVDRALIDAALAPARSLSDSPPGDRVRVLLARMAEVARPGEEAGRMLDVLSRVARASFTEGLLDVLLQAHPEGTVLDVLVYDGLSYQRVFPTWLLPVALDEFVEWIARNASDLMPLALVKDVPGTEIHLQATGEAPKSQRPELNLETELERSPTVRIKAVKLPPEAVPPPESDPDAPPPTRRVPPPSDGPHQSPTARMPAAKAATPDVSPTPPKSDDELDETWE